MFNKKDILNSVLRELEKNLEVLTRSAVEAREAATHEDAKAENKYDTRGLEASYLAGAQARRAKEMQDSIEHLRKLELKNYTDETPIGPAALIEVLVNEEESRWFFMLPSQGGIKVSCEDETINTVSPSSPLGKKLFDATVGVFFELPQKKQNVSYEVTQIW